MRLRILCTALAAATLLLIGCTEKTEPPTFANPLDPAGPNGGDPFQIDANYLGGSVVVTWEDVDHPAVAGFVVLRAPNADGPWSEVGAAGPTASSLVDDDFLPNAENYYLVRVQNEDGSYSAISGIALASVVAPPILEIGDTNFVYVRDVELTIRTAIGDSAQIDPLEDFSTGLPWISLDVDPDEEGLLTVTTPWTLGPAPEVDSRLKLYLRVNAGGVASLTAVDSVRVKFAPSIRVSGQPATIGTRTPDLTIHGAGTERMRFALDEVGLAVAAFVDYAETTIAPTLADVIDTQQIFAELQSEFGFTDTVSIDVLPDALDSVVVELNGGQPTTSDSVITVAAVAGATRMRLGRDGFLTETLPWRDYAPEVEYRLADPCTDGPEYQITVQYRNEWVDTSAPYTNTLTWIPPDLLAIEFAVPDTLAGGLAHELSGTATRHTCGGDLALIEIDTGSGWEAATGLADWLLDWNAPAVTADSLVTLHGRAVAGTDTATIEHEVVLTP